MPVTRTGGTWTVETVRPIEYSVSMIDRYFSDGDPNLILGGATRSRKRAVVIDHEVHRLYGDKITAFFDRHEIDCRWHVCEITESNKDLDSTIRIWDWLAEVGVYRRSEPIIAIGGGAMTDVVGFATSCDARGKPWVRVVTTGQMIDAGTSAKTGCNRNGKKSRLGSFHPPIQTIVDRSFLASTSKDDVRDNMAEAIKYALMHDAALFRLIDQSGLRLIDEQLQGDTEEGESAAREYLARCLDVTLEANADNLEETNLWRTMFFGHIWSGAWESAALQAGRTLSHGRAVNLDMALSIVVAWKLGLLTDTERDETFRVMRKIGLPTYDPLLADTELLRRATDSAIADRDGHLLAPLPERVGAHNFQKDVSFGVIADAANWLAVSN
jgi:2-epi-5-epi-valiolone synthase